MWIDETVAPASAVTVPCSWSTVTRHSLSRETLAPWRAPSAVAIGEYEWLKFAHTLTDGDDAMADCSSSRLAGWWCAEGEQVSWESHDSQEVPLPAET